MLHSQHRNADGDHSRENQIQTRNNQRYFEEYRLIDTQEPAAFQQILPCDLKGRFFPRTLDEGDFDEDFHDCG